MTNPENEEIVNYLVVLSKPGRKFTAKKDTRWRGLIEPVRQIWSVIQDVFPDVPFYSKALILSINVFQESTPSASGKTLVVATTHGNVPTECEIDGKKVVIGLNAYIKK